jgi:long-chain acyl-CoA synthetase
MDNSNTAAQWPWIRHYEPGVPAEIDIDAYRSIPELLGKAFQEYATRVAYENMGVELTFAQIEEHSRNFAAWLQQRGYQPGDRIAIQSPNLLQYPIVLFGALRAGLVVVNMNPLYTPTEMVHQLKDSGAVCIVILSNFAANLQQIIGQTAIRDVILSDIGDMLGFLKGAIVNFVVKRIKKMVPAYSLPKALRLPDVLAAGKKASFTAPNLKADDIAFLQYTGGTTGVSKGAALSHRNILANMLQIFAWVKPQLSNGTEIIITALPLYHVFALTVNCLAFFRIGGRNVLVTNPRDIKAFIKDLKRHPFTVFTGVNTMFNGLMNQEAFRALDFSSLRLVVGGAMAVQEPVAKRWLDLTKVAITEAYGLTETSPGVSANPLQGGRSGTIGVPIPSTEVILADDDGNVVPDGQPGEILVKGPQVMLGYWQKPEENAKTFLNGYLRTGDIAIWTEHGFLKIVDRKKEMILVSGFNVYPNEVEEALATHPGIAEAGVTGVKDEKTGEAVLACVVRKDMSLTEEQVIAHCRTILAAYKVPKQILFRTELPKSPIGKILRRKLLENA